MTGPAWLWMYLAAAGYAENARRILEADGWEHEDMYAFCRNMRLSDDLRLAAEAAR